MIDVDKEKAWYWEERHGKDVSDSSVSSGTTPVVPRKYEHLGENNLAMGQIVSIRDEDGTTSITVAGTIEESSKEPAPRGMVLVNVELYSLTKMLGIIYNVPWQTPASAVVKESSVIDTGTMSPVRIHGTYSPPVIGNTVVIAFIAGDINSGAIVSVSTNGISIFNYDETVARRAFPNPQAMSDYGHDPKDTIIANKTGDFIAQRGKGGTEILSKGDVILQEGTDTAVPTGGLKKELDTIAGKVDTIIADLKILAGVVDAKLAITVGTAASLTTTAYTPNKGNITSETIKIPEK